MTEKFDIALAIQKIQVMSIDIITGEEYLDKLDIDGIKKSHAKFHIGKYICKFVFAYEGFSWIGDLSIPEEEICSVESHSHGLFSHKFENLPNDKSDIKKIKIYLKAFIELIKINPSSLAYDFFQVSAYTLIYKIKKFTECLIKKQSGGHNKDIKTCKAFCGQVFSNWRERWLVITEEGLFHMRDPEISKVTETLLFDHNFSVEFGFLKTGRRRGMIINTSSRKLKIEAENYFGLLEILKSFNWAAKKSPYIQVNRFTSFAPVRSPNASVKWYINGCNYFNDICDALLQAKEEVYITDWWLSPELYLKRPKEKFEECRLDRVLGEIAMNGVKVNIIVYKEVTFALYNDSEHVQEHLQSISKNIRVIRHPNNFVFLWSHHEKMCVIDQKVGFMGGLDLCFGRFDTMDHPLDDNEEKNILFPGIDYVNNRICDFRNVRHHEHPLISKASVPRMPWRDIALKVVGEPVKDLVRHFIQYWNFSHIDLATEDLDQLIRINTKTEESSNIINAKKNVMEKLRKKNNTGNIVNYWGKQRRSTVIDAYVEAQKNDQNCCLNLVDMDNEEIKKLQNKEIYEQSSNPVIKTRQANDTQLLTQTLSKKSSQEVNVELSGEISSIKNECSYKERKDINLEKENNQENIAITLSDYDFHAKQNDTPAKRKSIIQNDIIGRASMSFHRESKIAVQEDFNNLLREAHYNAEEPEDQFNNLNPELINAEKARISMIKTAKRNSKRVDTKFIEENMLGAKFRNLGLDEVSGTCRCQLLRSSSKWSIGLQTEMFELSIQTGYIQVIQSAEHFIYIENQFFISSTAGDIVKNKIAEALAYKIKEAHEDGRKFKILVCLPLLPGFEGDVRTSPVLRIQMYWQYMTISRGKNSLLRMLEKWEIDPNKYIYFVGLRNHAVMNNTPVTELIYIHSKMMIVDDRIAIIGSANINDRSMCGNRDSELAMVIEDMNLEESIMDKSKFTVANFAHTLRTSCWANIFGMSIDEVKDPLCNNLWDKIYKLTEVKLIHK